MSWKDAVKDSGRSYYTLHTQEIGSVPVRLFLTPNLLDAVEESIYPQIVNAASFPGVKLVAITPDVHHGYGVPIGTRRGHGPCRLRHWLLHRRNPGSDTWWAEDSPGYG